MAVCQGMRGDLLPSGVGRVVDMVYCPPLLLQLCHDGTVCIHSSIYMYYSSYANVCSVDSYVFESVHCNIIAVHVMW